MNNCNSMKMSNVVNFYSGQSIFITGATGFMGKVLLEKILRTIPNINKIYILLRAKKGFSPEERIATMLQNKPFTFNSIDEKQLKKVIEINDIIEKDLGLSSADRTVIINDVSVVFHLAAAVKFDLPLKEAVRNNVFATKTVLELCEEIINLKSVVHLSTAFCNLDIDCMEERVYDILNTSPYKIMEMVEWMKDEDIAKIERSIISPHPNTYTFTKRLGEIVANDMGRTLPLTIIRPSIVTTAYEEPTPGWIDTLYGPIGLFVAAGKGVLQIGLMDKNLRTEYIPVDIGTDIAIVAGFIRGTTNFACTPVYNATRVGEITWGATQKKMESFLKKEPCKQMVWYPNNITTTNRYYYIIGTMLFQIVPAIFVDFLLIMCLQKSFLLTLQKKIYKTSMLTSYFTTRSFNFSKEGVQSFLNHMTNDDMLIFNVNNRKIDVDRFLYHGFVGGRTLVKDEPSQDFIWKVQFYTFYALDKLLKILVLYGIWKLLSKCIKNYTT